MQSPCLDLTGTGGRSLCYGLHTSVSPHSGSALLLIKDPHLFRVFLSQPQNNTTIPQYHEKMDNQLSIDARSKNAANDGVNHWDKLPDELRVTILVQAMGQGKRIEPDEAADHAKYTLLPYSLTCKSMDNLAHEIYYKNNSFVVNMPAQFRGLGPVLSLPGRVQGEFIQKLEIQLNVNPMFRTLRSMLESRSGWRFLLRVNKDVDMPPHGKLANLAAGAMKYDINKDFKARVWNPSATAWQDHLPHLKELKVVLIPTRTSDWNASIQGPACMVQHGAGTQIWRHAPYVNPEFAYDFGKRIQDTHIALRAAKIEVVVTYMPCNHRSHPHRNDKSCEQIIADVIRSKFGAPVQASAIAATQATVIEDVEMMDIDDATANRGHLADVPFDNEHDGDEAFVLRFVSDKQAGITEKFARDVICGHEDNKKMHAGCECCQATQMGRYP